jgi:hypothetical protein
VRLTGTVSPLPDPSSNWRGVTPRCGSGTTGLPQAFDLTWHLAEGGCDTQLLCENSAFDLPPFPDQAQGAGLQDQIEHEPDASFRVPLRTSGPGHQRSSANGSFMPY